MSWQPSSYVPPLAKEGRFLWNPRHCCLPAKGGEIVANLNFLFAAYTAIWVLLFLYILMLSRRNRTLQKEIDDLRELLQRRKAS